MEDERNKKAVDAAIDFGRGGIGEKKSDFVWSAAMSANEKQTADICRKILTEKVFELINKPIL